MDNKIKEFKVIPIDKNQFIFFGDACTGKTFFAKRIGALHFDITCFRQEDMESYAYSIRKSNLLNGIYPVVVYITTDAYTVRELIKYFSLSIPFEEAKL